MIFFKFALFTTIFLPMLFSNTNLSQTPPLETGISQTLAKWRAANYSDVRYKLNLTLEKMSPVLKGTIEIRLNVSEPPASAGGTTVILDWRKIRGKEDLSKVENVFVNDKPVKLAANPPADAGGSDTYAEINEHLVFKDGVKSGENVIKLDFTSPILTSGGAITRYVDKEDNAEYIYSLFVPSDASTAFPVFDQPDLKARFSFTVNAPQNWKVVSNTEYEILSPMPENDSTKSFKSQLKTVHQFKETKPISTYVFAFAAGDFAEVSEPSAVADGLTRQSSNSKTNKNASNKSTVSDAKLQPSATADGSDLAMKIYVRKSQAEKFKQHAAEVFRLNREGVKFLEDWFDYKFPFPKYDLVLIPEFPFGGMEHAGATFLREDRVIFPTEPTKNDYITRANVIFHEAAHQWFGDTVTMKWFDDLWLKEGFAEFMAYKTLAKVLPEYNAWKIFYERNKQAAYLTDVTRGTTPIYQEIPNLSAAKSAYGNIVYRKAPSFLRQAEFYLGEKEFQTAVRQFLKKHEFANAEWTDLVKEFESASKQDLKDWANVWVKQRSLPNIQFSQIGFNADGEKNSRYFTQYYFEQSDILGTTALWKQKFNALLIFKDGTFENINIDHIEPPRSETFFSKNPFFTFEEKTPGGIKTTINGKKSKRKEEPVAIIPNYQDYGYGIFLLDEKSRAYILENIQTEKDDFLRSMMWGSLWDSVRFYELAPEDYVKLVIKNINVETDESTIQTLLGRVSTAMNYYLTDEQSKQFALKIEAVLLNRMRDAKTVGQRITFYRAYLNIASSDYSQEILKKILKSEGNSIEIETVGTVLGKIPPIELPPLKTKDKFDIVTKLLILENKRILGNNEAEKLLAELEKQYTDDAAKRYAYAAKAGIPTKENKAKYWNDFISNKEISESYIESAFNVWNTPKHAELTLPYLEKALAELPNLKRNRKIFFVNGWLSSFIGGQKSEEALNIVNKFLNDNPNLDKDLRNKILENVDNLERAVKIRK